MSGSGAGGSRATPKGPATRHGLTWFAAASVGLAAALIGAGGLGAQSLLVSTAGLPIGFSRASALGLAFYVAGYGLGAWRSGRSTARPARVLAPVAVLVLLVPWLGVRDLLSAAAAGSAAWSALLRACLWITAAGAVQGALWPWLVRAAPRAAATRSSAWLFAANLAGCVVGARLFAFELVARASKTDAALAAGAASCVGVALLALVLRGAGAPASPGDERRRPSNQAESESGAQDASGAEGAGLGRVAAGLCVGLGTAWAIAVEWLALRHALLWIDSQEETLNAVLAASLAALALGAALSAFLPAGRRGVLATIPFLVLGTLWLAFGAPLAASFAEGQGGEPRFVFVAALVAPALLGFGAWIPTLYRAVRGEPGERLGALFVHEIWGVALSAPLAHYVLVPRFGLGGALAACALLALPLAWIARPAGRGGALAAGLVGVLGLCGAAWVGLAPEPALASPLYRDPALSVRWFAEDGQFAVGVVDDGVIGERTLLTDRFRAAGTGRDYLYMRALGHLPVLLHPAPRRAAVMCLGTGTTLGAVFQHPEVERIDVLEISPAVVAAAPWFEEVNHGALLSASASRVRVDVGDGRRLLADRPATYDVITMEPLLPDSPFGVYLYTREFYGTAKRALAPGGILCQWVPPHALAPEVFEAVCESFAHAFPWSGRFLFGTQLVLIGAEREPALDAARFPSPSASRAPLLETALDTELATALAAVNLEDPAGVLAAFCGASPWPAATRPLSDDAPWIVYREKRADAGVFDWPGANLGRLLALRGAPESVASATWRQAAGASAEPALRLGELVLRARIDAANEEARARRGQATAGDWIDRSPLAAELAAELAAPGAFAGAAGTNRGPGAGALGRALLEEQRFLAEMRRGVALIPTDPRAAADRLLDAALLRRERADVHLYVAAALFACGDRRGATAAKQKALELCPRVLETPAGVRALALGLP